MDARRRASDPGCTPGRPDAQAPSEACLRRSAARCGACPPSDGSQVRFPVAAFIRPLPEDGMTTRMRTMVEREGSNTPAPSPLFLVGPARSGTSLLYKVLCLHPDASYVSNWLARFPSQTRLAALNRVARRYPELQRSVWFGQDGANAYVYGRRRALRERMFPMPVEGEPLFAA